MAMSDKGPEMSWDTKLRKENHKRTTSKETDPHAKPLDAKFASRMRSQACTLTPHGCNACLLAKGPSATICWICCHSDVRIMLLDTCSSIDIYICIEREI